MQIQLMITWRKSLESNSADLQEYTIIYYVSLSLALSLSLEFSTLFETWINKMEFLKERLQRSNDRERIELTKKEYIIRSFFLSVNKSFRTRTIYYNVKNA